MSKTTVVFHSADFDGIFCREIARKFLPYAELIGWDFGDKPLEIPKEGTVYILDLPVDRPFGLSMTKEDLQRVGDASQWYREKHGFDRVIWIDHHKSSIDTHPKNIPGYRIDGVAACRLAWQYFSNAAATHSDDAFLPFTKQDFIDRKVIEPLAVRLAGEYDIWDKRDPRAELFQHGLRSRELTPDIWETMLGNVTENSLTVDSLLHGGEVLQYARTNENASIIKELGFTLKWEGLAFLCCNAARYSSHLFTAALTPEHDACFGFKWKKGEWEVSLYHAPGKEHHDLSLIAVKHGGGGHRGACGFRMKALPFMV